MEILIRVILCSIAIASFVLPAIIYNLFLCKSKKKVTLTVIYGMNVCFTTMLHRILRGHFNVPYTLKQLWILEWSYEEITDLSNMLSLSLVFFCILIWIFFMQNKCYFREKRIIELKVCIIFLLATVTNMSGYCVVEASKSKLLINEVASKNTSVYLLQNESYCDYIEFYNTGNLIYTVKDLYVSDDVNNLRKIKLRDCQIRPGDFLLLGLDQNKNTHCIKRDGKIIWYSSDEEFLSTSFVISELGENVYLSDEYGNILETVYTENQKQDIAYARVMDGQELWHMQTYTPGESNAKGYVDKEVMRPKFSHNSGFYENSFELEITADTSVDIYYTLDGRDPRESGVLYTEPIYVYDRSKEKNVWNSVKNVVADWNNYTINETLVDKAFIIRAVAKDKDENAVSEIVSATYFINKDKYRDKNVISLIAEPEDLFGDEGILVTGKDYDTWYEDGAEGLAPAFNWDERGRGSEVDAEVEVFSKQLCLKDSVGLRVQGGSRRANAKKSMSIVARKEYGGSKWLKGSLFDDYQMHSLQLRSGRTNVMLSYLVQDRNVDTQKSESVVLFLNGEYWENTYLQEKFSESYFESKYNLNDNSVMMVKDGGRVFDEYVEVPAEYEQIYSIIENEDLSEKKNYERFKEIVDINSYIDFSCINLYWTNMDWTEYKNYAMWRASKQEQFPYGDGKWRWILYDLDAVEWGMPEEAKGIEGREYINPFTMAGDFVAGQSYGETPLYMALKKNPEFCRQMVITFMDLINYNFSVENVDKIFSKWGLDSTWNNSFFVKRQEPMIKYIKEEFGLYGNVEEVEIGVNDHKGGNVKVNSIYPNFEDGSWSGKYFTDYPIEIEAFANEGYRFVKWDGDVDFGNEKISIEIKDGGTKIVAIFEKE